MKKLFIIAIIMLVAMQLSACTIKSNPPTPTLVATFTPTGVPVVTTPPAVISTTSVTPSSTPIPTASPVPKLTVQEVKLKIDSGSVFVLVDVRSKADYDKSHIVGAVSIPIQELPTRYIEIPTESEIIVYSACT